jgi:hypothetical protein
MVAVRAQARHSGNLELPSDALDFDGADDEELTALALAADPRQPLDPDAVPIDFYLSATGANEEGSGLLPEWYMPPAMARRFGRFGRAVVVTVVGAFLLIEAFGLCSTYGQLPFH